MRARLELACLYTRIYPSIVFLVLANLIPFYGAIFLGWDILALMRLFWLETAVIGIFSIVRQIIANPIFSIFTVPFFIFHFGAFMSIHLIFINALFGGDQGEWFFGGTGFLVQFMQYASLYWVAVIALFVSHGYSLISNYINKEEYKRLKPFDSMGMAYDRVMLMHFTLLLGGGLVAVLGAPIYALVFLLVLKLAMDVTGHVKEHEGAKENQT